MANTTQTTKRKNIGQPEIMVAQTIIGRDSVTICLPKSILSQVNMNAGNSFFCITNGVIQISGDVPSAVMPPLVLDESSYVPHA